MNNLSKHILLAIALLTGIAILSGCEKTNNSIVGQWNLNTQEAIAKTPTNTLYDSLLRYPLGSTFTLRADDSYDLIIPTDTSRYGAWQQTGASLRLTRTGSSSIYQYNIMTVSTHSMTLQYNDTFSTSPLVIIDRIDHLSR